MKGTFRRIVAGILMIAMILPNTALAAEYNLDNGDITIVASGADDTYIQTVTQNQTTTQDAAPVITQTSESTSNTITVNAADSQATVTIQGVNIEAVGEAAITTSGDVTIQVSGENAVSSDTVILEGKTEATGGTAIEATGSLTITGAPDTEVTEEPAPAEDNGTEDTTTAEESPIVPENSLTVEGENTAIDVDGANSSDGELIIGNGNSNDETKGDIEVTAVGGKVGIDANVTVDDGYLNAYGDVYGNAADSGIGVDGSLTVEEGAAAVYGDDIGVNGNVAVGTQGSTADDPDIATTIIQTNRYGSPVVNGTQTVHENGNNIQYDSYVSNYIPEYSGTMYHSYHGDSGFDIKGNYNNTIQQTTYSDDGYETYLRIGGSQQLLDDTSGAQSVNGLNVKVDLVPKKGGKVMKIVYTVANESNDSITFDLGAAADIMIGSNDRAAINILQNTDGEQVGLSMVDDQTVDGAQFNFFGKNDAEITDVDTFWYGYYFNRDKNVFSNEPEVHDSSYDSGMAWSWLDNTVPAGKTLTFSVLIGIGGKGSESIAGGVVPDPEPTEPEPTEPEPTEPKPTEPEQKPIAEPAPAPAAPSSQLTIKLDTIKEVIDLASSTQDGKPMEKLEATSEMTSGKTLAPEDAIVVCKAETTADATVEDITKEDVAMAFTVAYMRKGVVSNLPGNVKLSIPAPADSLEGYVLVFVQENSKQIEIPYELLDGKVVFTTDRIGLYMLIKK